MTPDKTAQYTQHRLEQLRRAASWPLSKRLDWLEQTLAITKSVQTSKPVAAPAWAK